MDVFTYPSSNPNWIILLKGALVIIKKTRDYIQNTWLGFSIFRLLWARYFTKFDLTDILRSGNGVLRDGTDHYLIQSWIVVTTIVSNTIWGTFY